jgi:hypothetical protein
MLENFFFVGIFSANDEKSRIRIRKSVVRIRGSGSVLKCQGSTTLLKVKYVPILPYKPLFYLTASKISIDANQPNRQKRLTSIFRSAQSFGFELSVSGSE